MTAFHCGSVLGDAVAPSCLRASAVMRLSCFSRHPALPSAGHITLSHKLKPKATNDLVDAFPMCFLSREKETGGDDPTGHRGKSSVPFHQQYSWHLKTTELEPGTGIQGFQIPLRTEPAWKIQYIRSKCQTHGHGAWTRNRAMQNDYQ